MENSINITLPKSWFELKPGQIEGIARLFLRCSKQEDLLTQCFLFLSGWRIVRWRMFTDADGDNFFFRVKGRKAFCIPGDVYTTLVKKLQWILEFSYVPAYVPRIKGFDAPNKLLFGVSLEQYLMADNYFSHFVSAGYFPDLDKMIASLYCKNFQTLVTSEAARKVAALNPKHSRYASFIWFSGVKTWMHNKYPYIFSVSSETSHDTPDESIMKLLSALNGGDITRNRTIMQSPVHEALFELNQKLEHYKPTRHV